MGQQEAGVADCVHSLQQPALLFSADGRLLTLNAAAKALFGIHKDTWQGEWFDALIPCPREYQRSVPRYLAHYQEVNPDQWEHPVMASKVTGERFPLSYTLSLLDDAQVGSLTLCLLCDIESSWQRYRAALVERDDAIALSHTKTQFLHHVGQGLRHPIGLLLNTLADIVDRPGISDYVRNELQNLYLSGRDAQRTLQEILDFTRLEHDQIDFQSVQFSIRRCMEDAVDRVANASRRKSVEIASLISPYVPEIVVGDPERLQQVLQNLLNNAVKFTSEGGITVKAWCDIETDTSATVDIEVTDTGNGMAAEQVAAIRRALAQTGGNLADRFGGLGIGLAISKEIVERMAGRLSVRSTEGVGTTFGITLTFTKGKACEQQPAALHGKKALLLHDHMEDRKQLESICQLWGMQTDYAGHGAQALTKLDAAAQQGKAFDCIFIDLQRMMYAGVNVARNLREHARFADLRIVLVVDALALTAPASSPPEEVDLVVAKPLLPEHLFPELVVALNGVTVADLPLYQQALADKRALPRRALLVEDNEVNQIIAQSALKKLGISADVTNNGEEAIDAVQDKHYDLILMDCDMPVMDGFQATRMIRSREKNQERRIPIIALTADESESCRQACLAAGMDDYMSKPFRADQLQGILQKFSHSMRTPQA